MTITEMMKAVNKILPKATIGEDFNGQIIIYTDKMFDGSYKNAIEFTSKQGFNADGDGS